MNQNPEKIKYGSLDKYGDEVGVFGRGHFCKVIPLDLPEKEVVSQILRLAWAHGCPVPKSVINIYGIEYAMDRYSTCNQAFRYIVGMAMYQRGSANLPFLLINPEKRLPDEKVGKHEPAAVPNIHQSEIAPMSGLYGYALPRLFLLRAESQPQETLKRQENYYKASEILMYSLAGAKNLEMVLVTMAIRLWQEKDIGKTDILSHIFPQCTLEEENCRIAYRQFAEALRDRTPEIAEFYQELTQSQKAELGIAEIPTLK